MNIIDLSKRRGAIVRLLPQVYELLKEEKKGNMQNIVLWTHSINKSLVDAKRKWLFALEGNDKVWGVMFYRLGDDGKSVYIDTLAVKKTAPPGAPEAIIKKFEQDTEVKVREKFYLGRDIKKEQSEAILEGVGLQDDSVYTHEGYQPLGELTEAGRALRLRYLR